MMTCSKRIPNRRQAKGILFILVLSLMALSVTVSLAAQAFSIQGRDGIVTISQDSAPWPGKGECWKYANAIYKLIWKENFSNQFSSGGNMLRDLNDDQRSISAEHTKAFISSARLGASIRISNARKDRDPQQFAHDGVGGKLSDGSTKNGHNIILVAKSATGFTYIESTDAGRSTHTKTWAQFASDFARYKYFKYIKYPNAGAYTPQPEAPYLRIRPGSTWPGDKNKNNGYPSGNLNKGKNFGLRGIIESNEMITMVKASVVYANSGADALQPVTVFPNTYSLNIQTSDVNNKLIFQNLNDGSYKYIVYAQTKSGRSAYLIESSFTVGSGSPQMPTSFTDQFGVYEITAAGDAVYLRPSRNETSSRIPDTITVNGKLIKVAKISERAFYNNYQITQVTIGKNVKIIGGKAFYGCRNLKDVYIKTTKLTANRIRNSVFEKMNKYATFHCPKSMWLLYKVYFTLSGAPVTCTFTYR